MKQPLVVVIAGVLRGNNILLVQRHRGTYAGLWALPGGKVNFGEHPHKAIIREITEETDVKAEFQAYKGIVSEFLVVDRQISDHFLLLIFKLGTSKKVVKKTKECTPRWFKLENLTKLQSQIIPSDWKMLEIFFLEETDEFKIYEAILEQQGNTYILQQFQIISS